MAGLTSGANSRIMKRRASEVILPALTNKIQFGKLLAVLLCVVLAVFMTVEVAHSHPDTPVDASHCQLCASAHVAVDTQPAWMTAYVLRLIERVSIGEACPGSLAVVVTAFIRPPPFSR